MISRAPRVALIAGTLAQGGAEKQLLYLVEALREVGADVRVLSLTRGEFFEPALRALGVEPIWVGRFQSPILRVASIAAALSDFRPHFVQAAHFYTNIYVALVAPLYGAIGIGASRSDILHEMRANGRWGRWLLRAPSALIVNSEAARRNAGALGIPAATTHVLPNAIDLDVFDACANAGPTSKPTAAGAVVIGVGTFIQAKRFDCFLRALAATRARGIMVHGILIGDGPERGALEALARDLGLLPDGVRFAGRRNDVPQLLRAADIYLLTSEHEGFPNVLLEAMAARLPVITTPAGDAGLIVQADVTGFVVPTGDIEAMASRLAELATSPGLRARLGGAGRQRVETCYTCSALPERVTRAHRLIAEHLRHRRSLAVLPG